MTTQYSNIEEIQLRKEETLTAIQQSKEKIAVLWSDLTTVKKSNDRGEMVAGIISKGIMAFDAVMVVSKLYRRYGSLFKKKKRG